MPTPIELATNAVSRTLCPLDAARKLWFFRSGQMQNRKAAEELKRIRC
jgi:hypothetical protein